MQANKEIEYVDILVALEDLHDAVERTRYRLNLTQDRAAVQMGISDTTLSRLRYGGSCSLYILRKIVVWLAKNDEIVLRGQPETELDKTLRESV